MRYLWAAICFVSALLFAAIAWGPPGTLRKVFEDYQDSPDSTYVIVALPFLLVSAAFLIAAIWLIWPRQR